MNKTRDSRIDFLRGFAMIAMVITHTTAYFPSEKVANTIWNWSNFAVPIFIFCSVYLFFSKYIEKPVHFFSYIKKRSLRLLIPYYIFLLFFIPMLYFINPEKVSLNYIINSVLVIGGVDINWLVLLFLYITILPPTIVYFWHKQKILFWGFFALSLASSIYLLFDTLPFAYKWIMWIPWSVILYFTFFYIFLSKQKHFTRNVLILVSILFIESIASRVFTDQSLVLTHNKYPPNMFYLSYGMLAIILLPYILQPLGKISFIAKTFHFFSFYSYQIYFLHYLILIFIAHYLAELGWNWIVFTAVVFAVTISGQMGLIFLEKKLRSRPSPKDTS